MSPKFNNIQIFDCVTPAATYFSAGVLQPRGYTKIRQKIHFNGENGDRYLTHGWSDRPWTFKGILSAPNVASLWTILARIQGYIDEADTDSSTYHPLVDSFGNPFDQAQIHSLEPGDMHIAQDGTAFMPVVVAGIIAGMESDGSD